MKYRCKTAWAINMASIIPNISTSYCAKRPPLKSFPNGWTSHFSSVIVISLTRCHNQGRATNEKLLVNLACLSHFHVNTWGTACASTTANVNQKTKNESVDVSCSFKLLCIIKINSCQCKGNNLTHEQGEPFHTCGSTITHYNWRQLSFAPN